jgi:hypothetical protein
MDAAMIQASVRTGKTGDPVTPLLTSISHKSGRPWPYGTSHGQQLPVSEQFGSTFHATSLRPGIVIKAAAPLAASYNVIVLSTPHHGPTVQPCTTVVARAKHAKTSLFVSLQLHTPYVYSSPPSLPFCGGCRRAAEARA